MSEYKRILVVSRMIQSSRGVIQTGISLARKYDAQLYVIHSIHNPFSLKGWSMGLLSLAKEYEKILKNAKRDLSELVASEKTRGMTIIEFIREGEPTEEILKTIEEEDIDLVVMLAHTEGRLEDLFFNRSNDELVRKMPCSIMLVKHEAQEISEEAVGSGEEDEEEEEVTSAT
ncbi:MAG: universal stress protein [Proteobacteria bacterium]|nr:universal stress protein [Pseudomonadota bacterium]MBU1685801.1 universal stress protein [Pseudomonadota bacterium]